MENNTHNIAIIFAGGAGKRMGNSNGMPKQFLLINKKPVLVHTIENFNNNPHIDEIIIVMLPQYIQYTYELIKQWGLNKVTAVVAGGKNGQQSIYNGLVEAKKHTVDDIKTIVLIHDGVRPIMESDLIERNIESVQSFGTAISSIPAYETEVIAKDYVISDVINRNNAWIARAPQSFYLKDILAAHEKAIQHGDYDVIDSCSIIKQYTNMSPHIVKTIPENIKITTPIDYNLVRALKEIRSHEYEPSDK